jgi:hypothetical protein
VPSETLRGIGEPVASGALLQTTHRSMAAGWNHPSTWSGLPSLPYAVRIPRTDSPMRLRRVAPGRFGNRVLVRRDRVARRRVLRCVECGAAAPGSQGEKNKPSPSDTRWMGEIRTPHSSSCDRIRAVDLRSDGCAAISVMKSADRRSSIRRWALRTNSLKPRPNLARPFGSDGSREPIPLRETNLHMSP